MVERRSAIIRNESSVGQVARDFQVQLNAAETASADASINSLLDNTAQNQKFASEARTSLQTVQIPFDHARAEMKLIPSTKEKLLKRTQKLKALKCVEERGVIHSQITDITQFKDAAKNLRMPVVPTLEGIIHSKKWAKLSVRNKPSDQTYI